MRYRKELQEWDGIQPWFWPRIARELPPRKQTPFLKARRKGGRPRGDDRKALGAIFWRLRCGGAWSRLPRDFGPAITAQRRLALWLKGDILERAWRAYLYPSSREMPFWRFGLDLVWRREFEPLLATGEGQ